MAGLIIALAWLAAVVLAAVEFLAHVVDGFSCPGWVGWLAVLIIAVLGAIGAFTVYRAGRTAVP